MTENKGITLLYISNGIHFKLSSLSAENVKWEPYGFPFFCVITRVLRSQVAENEGLRRIWTDSGLMYNDWCYLIIIIALVITNLITDSIFRLILVINFM